MGQGLVENATVVRYEQLAGCLFRLFVRPDWDLGALPWEPGQFFRLGTVTGAEDDKRRAKAYSFAGVADGAIEFLIVEIAGGKLTPELATLREGDRLWCEEKAQGHFSLERSPEGRHLWLIGTGAAIAPYVCMIRHRPERVDAFERVVVVHCARKTAHLVHGAELAAWCADHDRRRYVPVVSRPDRPFEVKDGHAPLLGHVTTAVADGRLEAVSATAMGTEDVVMLCGNPGMLKDVGELLKARGMTRHSKKNPGQLVLERWW